MSRIGYTKLLDGARARRFDTARENVYGCVFVRAVRVGASGFLAHCGRPASHAVKAADGLHPMCLKHANLAARAGGFTSAPVDGPLVHIPNDDRPMRGGSR